VNGNSNPPGFPVRVYWAGARSNPIILKRGQKQQLYECSASSGLAISTDSPDADTECRRENGACLRFAAEPVRQCDLVPIGMSV
jgi:hypothetical protein